MSLQWCELDERAVKMAKALAGDAVENAGSGHPGTAISLAAAAYVLFQRHLRFDPQDANWLGRDRFVLSAGHASLTQYVQLYLADAGLKLQDLREFRKMGSATPGHPEFRHTAGVEITTGPLGSGFAAAVGMAMESRFVTGMLDPNADARALASPFGHRVFSIVGDGCLQEGITHEAAALAGTQKLNNLVVIYDNNQISIEDDTQIAMGEDVLARFEAYGWRTETVDWVRGSRAGENYFEDVEALDAALERAKAETDRPTLINLRTIIGWPTPNKANTGTIHGAPLGKDDLAGLKEALGLDPQQMFAVDEQALKHAQDNAAGRGREAREEWEAKFARWEAENPDQAKLLERLLAGKLPENIAAALPRFGAEKPLATRAASGQVINALAAELPELWGGSADLAGSNNTLIKGADSFLPPEASSRLFNGSWTGRNLHFGVREHGMGAVMNGIALDGLTRVYGGTFFVFSDYMRGAVRLAALMQLPVTYVWTHDSVGVGEDGPTHQPVEHLTAYRAIPGLAMVRPADANETAWCWLEVLRRNAPAALVLTRQNVPVLELDGDFSEPSQVGRGAYVLRETGRDAIIMASGSEVHLALAAQDQLAGDGVGVRVVSVPCMEWFEEQDQEYKDSVLDPQITARVSVEAGLALPWLPYLGAQGRAVSIETFGLPASGDEAMEHFGMTADNVVATVRDLLA